MITNEHKYLEMNMKKDQEYEELIEWVPEDGYDDDADKTSNKDDALEGIDQKETGC
jgi:hypothetical protein